MPWHIPIFSPPSYLTLKKEASRQQFLQFDVSLCNGDHLSPVGTITLLDFITLNEKFSYLPIYFLYLCALLSRKRL